MRQLLLPEVLSAGQRVELAGADYHYLAHVLRRGRGDEIDALDARGSRWRLSILDDGGDRFVARVAPSGDAEPEMHLPPITVYQAIPKGRKLDEWVRALVQAGVHKICPLVTDRTVVQPERGGTRVQRWQRIAREAVQQSGASRPVVVTEPRDLADVVPAADALSLVLHTEPIAQTTLHGYLGVIPNEVELLVGPEGGLTDVELESVLDRGFAALWLGPQVLRSESAALFAAAAIRILILERAHWQPVEL